MIHPIISYDADGAPIVSGDKVQVVNKDSSHGLYGKIGRVGNKNTYSDVWVDEVVFEDDSDVYTIRGNCLRHVIDEPDISLPFEDIFNNTEGG